ncbi:MAG TPA: Uma2 family endonuclease [Fimbriiglobus sp.]|jgi:Uma2 family endonuclease
MSTTRNGKVWTTKELLDLPEDGKSRWLIRGTVWETEMTKRNRLHSKTMARVAALLDRWLETQPEPRGEVCCGEVGFIIRKNPDSTVGIDVAYVDPKVSSVQFGSTTLYDGIPTVAVEILSPNNTDAEVVEKVQDYLACGVPHVWVIQPTLRTITVYRPDHPAAIFSQSQIVTAEPHLPGFSAPADAFFTIPSNRG